MYLSTSDQEIKDELLIHRCATDIELFCVVFFPHYCSRAFNDFHKAMFKTFKYGERNVRRVRAAPRGSAKSTLITLIKPIHDLCYSLEKFIVIISATKDLANKKVKNIRSEIQFNDALKYYFGVHFPTGKAGESEFLASSKMGSTHFLALGKGSAVRGVSIGEARPTKVICDDVEDAKEVLNEAIRQKDADWYYEDVGKAGDIGTNFDFVGTVLHHDSLLKKLLKNPRYDTAPPYKAILSWSEREDLWNEWREIYRNVDDQERLTKCDQFFEKNKDEMLKGTVVSWPEKESYLDHMIDMEEVGRRAFMKEKQNDPQGANDKIFEKIWYYKEVPEGLQILETGAIIPWANLTPAGAMDPATGQETQVKSKLPDYTCMPSGYKDTKGRLFVHHDFTKRVPPSKSIEEIFNHYDRFQYERFAVETNLFRNLLLPNIITERERRKEKQADKYENLAFYEVVQTENKHERIYRMEPKVNHGFILFNIALSRTFMDMFHDFPFADHDDAPDAVEILWNLVHNRYKPAPLSLNAMAGR